MPAPCEPEVRSKASHSSAGGQDPQFDALRLMQAPGCTPGEAAHLTSPGSVGSELEGDPFAPCELRGVI